MSVEELKHELANLDAGDRRNIMAYLISIEDQNDPEYLEKMACKIEDKNPAHWITLEELEKKFSLGPYDNGE
jgi:hypothetical protein